MANRSYNSEKLEWQTDAWSGEQNDNELMQAYYRDLFETLRNGAPLKVSPQSVRCQIAIIERAKALGGSA